MGDPESLLDPNDLAEFKQMKERLATSESKYKWNRQVDSLVEALEALRTFCIRHNESDWKRCLVCGIFWLDLGFVINIRQMTKVIGKCKSSINGVLLKLGYSTLQLTPAEVYAHIAGSYNVPAELIRHRQWTVRRHEEDMMDDNAESLMAEEEARQCQCCACPLQWIHDHKNVVNSDFESLIES